MKRTRGIEGPSHGVRFYDGDEPYWQFAPRLLSRRHGDIAVTIYGKKTQIALPATV